ncbi:MAG: hypothetical protein H0V11_01375 [Actinobacteria bacterium]|nr:hypothetical protein [Actinomycetota bacterium]
MLGSLRLCCLVLTCLALTACGGGSSENTSATSAEPKTDTRAGYFHEQESLTLNPAIKKYQDAAAAYERGQTACNEAAVKLYNKGASPRDSVKCHFRETQTMLIAIAGVRGAVGKLNGEYRTACDSRIKRFATFLDKMKASWRRVHSDWTAYAINRPVPVATLNRDARTTGKLSYQFLKGEIPALAKACYTPADRAKG